MASQQSSPSSLAWLTTLLVAGLASAVATMLAPLSGLQELAGIFGAITAAIAIVLTFVIARRQARESSELTATVEKIDEAVVEIGEATARLYRLTLDVAERDSEQGYEGLEDEAATNDPPDEDGVPPYATEALERLRAAGSKLTRSTALWRRKVPEPAIRGNHGWFVESNDPTDSERWYVRKGRYWNIRKAMPRDLLDALEAQQRVSPTTIRLDFQLKEHGLASWYARTYAGDLWRVWKPNRSPARGIQTERVADEPEPN